MLELIKNFSIFTWTPELPEKFQNSVFWRYFEFLQLGNSNRSKNNLKNFFWKYLKNDGHSKFWHSRWSCWFTGWDNFIVNLAQSCDEHMLKISMRYLKGFWSNCWFTEKFWWTMAYVQSISLLSAEIDWT